MISKKEAKKEVKKAKDIVTTTDKKESSDIKAIVVTEKGKIIALDVVVLLTVAFLLFRFVISPLFGIKHDENRRLYSVIKSYSGRVFNTRNILLLLLFVAILAILFSFNDHEFKKIGLILLISYITSLAVEAKLFMTGALISGVTGYLYIRLLTYVDRKKEANKKKKQQNIQGNTS